MRSSPKKKPKRNRVYFQNPPSLHEAFTVHFPPLGARRISVYYAGRGLCSVEDAAQALEVSKMSLYRWTKEGRIRAVSRDDTTRIPHAELARLLKGGTLTPE